MDKMKQKDDSMGIITSFQVHINIHVLTVGYHFHTNTSHILVNDVSHFIFILIQSELELQLTLSTYY